MSDRVKVLVHLNHLAHEFDFMHIAKYYPIKFYMLETNVRKWSKSSARPLPETWLTEDEFEWVQYYEPGKYDLAILRLDQQCTDPTLGKGHVFRQLNDLIQDCPKIVINHGCTIWDDMRTEDMVINGGDLQTPRGMVHLDGMKELTKDAAVMVTNSYTAAEHWGWGFPIIHGFDSSNWTPYDKPKEPRVILPVSPAGLDKYYNRSLMTAIKSAVKERTGLDVLHFNVNLDFDKMGGDHWDTYRDFVGRSLIAIFPFFDSPMPRSRTECMMEGVCVLSSRHHGADEYIENGVNGFILPDNPLSYAEAIHILIMEGYRDAVKIGQEGKKTAIELFEPQRYFKQWWWLINEVLEGRKPVWQGDKIWDKS